MAIRLAYFKLVFLTTVIHRKFYNAPRGGFFTAGAQEGPREICQGVGECDVLDTTSKRCAKTYHLLKSRRAPLALLEGLLLF